MNENTGRKSGAVRRQERYSRENREKKKIRITAISVVVVLAVLFCGAMLINSNYIRRAAAAVRAGELTFSPAEFDFFFNEVYYEYQQMVNQSMADYASQLLPASNKSLKSQTYNHETGQTWADYMEEQALIRIADTSAIYTEAKNAGFTLPDERREDLEKELDTMKTGAEMLGFPSVNRYLQAMYGPGMNEQTMRKVCEIMYVADAYKQHINESFNYSSDEINTYYDENKDTLDTFTYRYFLVKSETVEESDFGTTGEYDEANAAAIAEAVAQGEAIVAGIKSEQDFIDAARAYDAETYAEDDSTLRYYGGELLGEVQGTWLRESGRAYGDVTAVEFTTGCYVMFFVDRSSNDYNVANIRQLRITPEVSHEDHDDDEDEAVHIEAMEKAISDAREQAELVLAALEEGGGTEEKFIELISEYSDDTTEGGLYENLYRHQLDSTLTPEVNEWPFIANRKAGDYELLSDEEGNQYIVFFSSFGPTYHDYLADTKMRERDYSAWNEAVVRPETHKQWAFILARRDVPYSTQ